MATEEDAVPAADDESPSVTATLHLDDLKCPLCLDLLCKPLSLPCGHSFCTICIQEAQKKSQKKCPSCRAVCNLNMMQLNVNVLLDGLAQRLFPAQYAERLEGLAAVEKQWERTLPIFFYNQCQFPGAKLKLHLFEERYKHMIQRVICESRRFAYLPCFTRYAASEGDVGLVVHLDDCQFFSDGRCLLQATMKERYRITNTWEEDSTFGLHYCEFEYLRDAEVPEEKRPAVAEKMAALWRTVDTLSAKIPNLKETIVGEYGPEPGRDDWEAWTLWVSAMAVQVGRLHREAQAFLRTTDVEERVRMCSTNLEGILAFLQARERPAEEQLAEEPQPPMQGPPNRSEIDEQEEPDENSSDPT